MLPFKAPLTAPKIQQKLLSEYGPQSWWPAKTRFEVIVGTYLTQNTSWRNAELAIANLRKARVLSLKAFREARPAELRRLLRPSGFYRQKAANLKAFVQHVDRRHRGSLGRLLRLPPAELRAELLSLPGVGPETADCILLYAANKPVFVVDAYAKRLLFRHGLVAENAAYGEIQRFIEEQFAARFKGTALTQALNEFHALIVETGKRHCGKHARCQGCPLEDCLPQKIQRNRGDSNENC